MSSSLIQVTGLDLEPGYEEAFDHWYETEYLPAILSQSGREEARLYRCTLGEPSRLTIFDLNPRDDARAPRPPFLHEAFGRRIRNYQARTLKRISSIGAHPAAAGFINLITVEIDASKADAFSDWYSRVHTPEIVACPGWLGGERFESLDGDPRFMAIYGLEDSETPFGTAEYEAAVGWDGFETHLRGYHGFRIFRLENVVRADV